MASQSGKNPSQQKNENERRLIALYDEYYDKVAHYAYARIGDKVEAEDIASEVFLKALKSIKTYEEQGVPMQAWLFKIAHNLVVDYYRRISKVQTVPIDKVEITDNNDPAELAEKQIEIDGMKTAMQKLTEDQRQVLQLRFFGGLTSREVADVMNKTDGSVREMQRAALEKLRLIMQPDNTVGF
jgi:RNA polymerase sigma-70 factor, ECF subfamily